MVSDATRAVGLSSRRRSRRSEVTLLLFAMAVPVGAVAWIVNLNTTTLPSGGDDGSSEATFAERFRQDGVHGLRSIDRAETAFQLKLHGAKTLLAQQLRDEGWRASVSAKPLAENANPAAEDAGRPVAENASPAAEDAGSVISAQTRSVPVAEAANPAAENAAPVQKAESVPLPRSRPAQADLAAMVASSQAYAETLPKEALPKADNRTVMQKLSDMFPGKMTLASLTPDSGLYGKGPDLVALGYDSHTAVYDISARKVYLPGGVAIEAHSGLGSMMDDPNHVNQRMQGATPPATYDLKPRETLFHGVRALRMIPTSGSNTLGRTGLLTHPYMLGPNGDSNGCVSIKFYERFLKSYDDGEINRLVVVPSLKGGPAPVFQRASSDS